MERITNVRSFGSGNVDCANVTNSYNNTITMHGKTITVDKTDDPDNQIKQWLSPLEPRHRHQSVQTNRVDGVGDWLLGRNEFREWSGNQGITEQAILFGYGDPGVGKTYISSLVIDWLCNQVRDRDIVVAGLYCDYLAQKEQSATKMLGAILKQLLERDGIPEPLRQFFRKEKRGFGGRAVQLLDLVEMLKIALTSLPEVFICVDGLDECLPNNRRELLESLRDIVRAFPTTRVFLSGRPHIRDEIKKYFTGAVMIAVIPTIGDIERYLEMRLDRDPTPSAMDHDLRVEIMRIIPRAISQIFLLVSLNIDAVLEEVTVHQRRKKLNEMIRGNGLQSAYSATLARIKEQKGSKSRLGMEALMWLSHSERPLEANELCDALGVEIGSTDLNSQNIPTIQTLLGCSLGLVIIEVPSYTLRLVHYTLQEYLSNNTDLFQSAHSMIAEVCLTYLNFQSVRDLPLTHDWSESPTTLLRYASRCWGAHARREITESVKTLALRLLDGFDKHISSWIHLYYEDKYEDLEPSMVDTTGFTGLHSSAYVGMVEIAAAILSMKKWNFNATDSLGNTAISWAAREGHGDIVKMLLEQEDVAPNAADQYGRTPLWWAVEYNHKEVAKSLLERRDVTPDAVVMGVRTPLLWAARIGYEDVVRILLGREDVTPDKADEEYGRTALSWAAEFGNDGVVRMLLERENVSPNTPDKDGRTPLWWAAEFGKTRVLEMLLERENVTPSTPDMDGQTPLLCTARNGHRCAVKVLLERGDAVPNTPDNDGRTPLLQAAANGHGATVEILLEREEVILGTADKDGRTPLSRAAEFGKEDVVKLLLKREDVTPNTADKNGRTPLLWGAGNGHEGIVKMLLEREDVIPDIADKDGRTPLLWAAGNGHEHAVEILLGREDAAPNTRDKRGHTPLSWAAGNGHGGVVKLLLRCDDVTPNTADKDGRTPLLWAAGNDHRCVVKMLLEREDVALNTADKDGRTPLSQAAGNGHGEIVRMLFNQADITPNIADKDGRTPLVWVAKNRHRSVVNTLLELQDLTPTTADKGGRTPLSPIKKYGHTGLVEMLPEPCNVSQGIVTTNPTGQTAVAQTSEDQHGRTLKRSFEDLGFVIQAPSSNNSTGLFPPKRSESSQRHSKRTQIS